MNIYVSNWGLNPGLQLQQSCILTTEPFGFPLAIPVLGIVSEMAVYTYTFIVVLGHLYKLHNYLVPEKKQAVSNWLGDHYLSFRHTQLT